MTTDVTPTDTKVHEVGTARTRRVEHFTPAERAARGKAARAEIPRSAHAAWEPTAQRRSPVDLLEEQAQTRVPELVPIRYGRMLVSPFTFYRGGAYLMAADLAGMPRTGLHVQLCGDAHLSNFGMFAAPDRRLVFSINDFDETLPGPFEWDVKRLVASFEIAGRDRGFDEADRQAINRTGRAGVSGADDGTSQRCRTSISGTCVSTSRKRSSSCEGRRRRRTSSRFERNVAKARTKDSLKAFAKLTEIVDGEPRIRSDPPIVVPIEELIPADDLPRWQEYVTGVIRSYRGTLPRDRRRLMEQYRYVDGARKVVGVGSVGTRAYIMLLLGRDGDDPLFLQYKEAQASVLEPFLGKSEFANCGRRVVEGQRLTQAASDIMLGWIRVDEGLDGRARDFYVRQLWDAKGSAQIEVDGSPPDDDIRQGVWSRARPRACPFGRRGRDRQLPGLERCVRPRARGVRGVVREPERARLRSAPTSGRERQGGGTGRHIGTRIMGGRRGAARRGAPRLLRRAEDRPGARLRRRIGAREALDPRMAAPARLA